MAKNQESINRSLFDLLRTKGYHPTLLDTSGKEIPVPEEAEVFQFKFSKEGKEYGTVTVTIDGLHKLVIYFGDEVANSEKEQHDDGDVSWYSLLRQLKRFALSHQLSFEIKNIDNLKYDMAKRAHMKKQEQISEGYYPMGKKASYSDNIPQTKIIIQHSRQIEEGEQRYRNVDKIFVENMNGERFLIPTNKPGIARVYARHIAEGGTPYDERGKHITSLVEEYQKMAGFVRATRSHQFNENAQKLVEQGINHYANLRETLNKMTGRKGYVNYFESYTPSLMEAGDEDTTINELFVQETLDPRIESVMPILQRLNKTVSEMKEVSELSEWADSLVEDEGIQSQNPVGIPEGRLDGLPDEDGPVVNAITRRILMQRVDLLSKFGPEKVAQAITAVADDLGDWIGPDDEIGSSDVSAWVKRVEQELSSLGEGEPGDLEHELERQDYEHDRERDEQAEKEMNEAERPGLWANIHAKRERIKHGSGEKMRKPGSKGAPTAQNFRDAAKEGIGEGNEILSPDTYELIDDYIAKIEPDADREEIAQSIIKGYIHPSELEYALQPDLDEGILDTIKKGAKAVGKAIVGKDDDELLRDLKKRAGVRNPQTSKPSMAISDVEKVDEVSQDTIMSYIKKRMGSEEDFDNMDNKKIDKMVKGLRGAVDRMHGKKPTSPAKNKEQGVAEDVNTGPQIIYATGPRTMGVNDVDLVFKDLRTGKIVAYVVGNNYHPGDDKLQEFAPSDGGNGGGGGDDNQPKTANYEIRMGNSKLPTYVAFGDPQQDSKHKVYKLVSGKIGGPTYYGMGMTLVSKLDWWSFLEKMLGEIMWEDDAIESGLVDRQDDGDLVFVKQQGVAEGSDEIQNLKNKIKKLEKEAEYYSFEPGEVDPKSGHSYRPNFVRTIKQIRELKNQLKQLQSKQGVAEDLDANQKRVDQLGPTEKVKNNNIGKLVGASESIQNTLNALTEMDSEGYKGTRDDGDSKGPEGKAKPITAKKAVSDAEKIMNKAYGKMMKSMSNKEKADKGWRNPNIKESIQLDEGVMDSIKGIVGKIKAIPGIQKFIQAAQAKKAELIQAAQQSRNGQELIKNIQAAVGGQQAVAEGWGEKLSGGLVASAGGGLMAAGAEMFMRAWNAMGKPDLAQMMNDPGRDGQIVLALVTMLVLVGALSLFGGGHMFKQGLEKDVQPMREGQEDLDAILRIIRK